MHTLKQEELGQKNPRELIYEQNKNTTEPKTQENN